MQYRISIYSILEFQATQISIYFLYTLPVFAVDIPIRQLHVRTVYIMNTSVYG
jgi:hypothetical protein